jgi:protease I
MDNKKILIVVAFKDFRDEEFFEPKEILEKANFQIDVASTEKGLAMGVNGGEVKVDFIIDEVRVDDYEAIIFVGGSGASRNIENQRFHHLAREAMAKNKILGAICIAPLILARAGVLENRKATVWASALDRRPIQQLKDGGATYENKPVVIDGNIVTANGPQSAKEFGKILAKELKKREAEQKS